MLQVVFQVTCRKDRPKLYGLFGAVFIEPLIGGALTDYVSTILT
jgi:hypothetical protein